METEAHGKACPALPLPAVRLPLTILESCGPSKFMLKGEAIVRTLKDIKNVKKHFGRTYSLKDLIMTSGKTTILVADLGNDEELVTTTHCETEESHLMEIRR